MIKAAYATHNIEYIEDETTESYVVAPLPSLFSPFFKEVDLAICASLSDVSSSDMARPFPPSCC